MERQATDLSARRDVRHSLRREPSSACCEPVREVHGRVGGAPPECLVFIRNSIALPFRGATNHLPEFIFFVVDLLKAQTPYEVCLCAADGRETPGLKRILGMGFAVLSALRPYSLCVTLIDEHENPNGHQ